MRRHADVLAPLHTTLPLRNAVDIPGMHSTPHPLLNRPTQVSMPNDPDSTGRKEPAQRSEWRGLIELVIGSAAISLIFLLAIFVALAN